MGRVGDDKFNYDLLSSNCEHFATYCCIGEEVSIQVSKYQLGRRVVRKEGFKALGDEEVRAKIAHDMGILCRHCYDDLRRELELDKDKDIMHVKEGDIVSYSYYGMEHDAVVLEVTKRGTDTVECIIAHYAFTSFYSWKKEIIEEKKTFYKKYAFVKMYKALSHSINSRSDVVRKARLRIGERQYSYFNNDSHSFARWCKFS